MPSLGSQGVPYEIMKVCFDSLEIIKKMAIKGNPNSITDVGVAMHCVKAAINGAFLNVKINCNELNDKSFVRNIVKSGKNIIRNTNSEEKKILAIVDRVLSK